MYTFVVAQDGTALMPTSNVKKVRKLLKSGRAEICRYRPFTIRLMYEGTMNTQPVEFTEDTGQKHIGISLKSEKHEYIHSEYRPLKNETERHNDCRKYRRTRRNRKRYRKARFDNRRRTDKWIAPTLQHIREIHISLYRMFSEICPITRVIIETATFDTQLLEALESGKPLPEGIGYQRGSGYGLNTLRDAVFYRDNHSCLLCGRKDGIFRVHHIGFWKNDRTDRMGNLATVCDKCHTPENHKPDGKLYGWTPKIRSMSGAAFMNTVRKYIHNDLRELGADVSGTYGSMTKTKRQELHLPKTHSNDAYAIGDFHPVHRCRETVYQKQRRNNRILEKFYDAKYHDIRDSSVRKGSELGCNRTNRKVPRDNELNRRIYRGDKVSKGRRNIRRQRYSVRPNDAVIYNGQKYMVKGIISNGVSVTLNGTKKCPSVSKIQMIYHTNGWAEVMSNSSPT